MKKKTILGLVILIISIPLLVWSLTIISGNWHYFSSYNGLNSPNFAFFPSYVREEIIAGVNAVANYALVAIGGGLGVGLGMGLLFSR